MATETTTEETTTARPRRRRGRPRKSNGEGTSAAATSKPRPRITAEDRALLIRGLQSLVREEEALAVEFASRCLIVAQGSDGPVFFDGGFAELLAFYDTAGMPIPESETRRKALDLIAKLER